MALCQRAYFMDKPLETETAKASADSPSPKEAAVKMSMAVVGELS